MTEPFRLTGLHHVQLAMPEGREEAAEAFYAGLLGLERVPKPPALSGRGGCWFRSGSVEVHLGVEPGFRPAAKAHPAFVVSGLGALRDRLSAAGVEVRPEVPMDDRERFHTADPFGNRLEFIEAGA